MRSRSFRARGLHWMLAGAATLLPVCLDSALAESPPEPYSIHDTDRDGDGRFGEQELTEARRYRMFHYHHPGSPRR
jgi:hypothetical protein